MIAASRAIVASARLDADQKRHVMTGSPPRRSVNDRVRWRVWQHASRRCEGLSDLHTDLRDRGCTVEDYLE